MSDEHGSVFQPINQSDMIARIESFDHDDADQSYLTPEPASFVAAPVAEARTRSGTCTCSRTCTGSRTGSAHLLPHRSPRRHRHSPQVAQVAPAPAPVAEVAPAPAPAPVAEVAPAPGTCSSCPGGYRACSGCPGGYRACSGRRGRSSPNSNGRGRGNNGRAGSDRRSRTGVSSRRPCPCPPHPLHPRWPGSCCWSVRPRSCR